MDNFRGFKDTHLRISRVNFLVGENSTGKSSVLTLINILSNPGFWYGSLSLSSEEARFGHFEDIVSIYSKDRSYFSVGCYRAYEFGDKKRKEESISAHLMRYKEHQGTPRLHEYFHYDGTHEVHAVCTPNSKELEIKYSYKKIGPFNSEEDFSRKVFKRWTKNNTANYENFHPVKENDLIRFRKMDTTDHNYCVHEILWAIDRDIMRRTEKYDELTYLPPILYENIAWLAPIRTKPRRTYDEYKYEFTPEGAHTPYIIKRILNDESAKNKFLRFARKIGKDSGLFESIEIKDYGNTSTSPFELDILLSKQALSINSVGYGVSQALPVIVEMFSRPKNACLAIQQPEVHLHPKAQAAFGKVVFELATMDSKVFFIETHSDYLIDRYRMSARNNEGKHTPDSQIIYFERSRSGNKLYPMQIADNGELPCKQPKGYRDFFIKEELSILGLD